MNGCLPGRACAGLGLGLLAMLIPAPGLRGADADVPTLIARIKSVGREGAGNPEAVKAWKALVARGPSVLPALLAGMNDDDPTSSNWLRVAVEAVASKAQKEGTGPDRDVLEKFVLDRTQPAVGRKLAYDWLVRLDKAAPARLLPTMLDDPGPELRREAVSAAIERAKEALKKKDKEGAKKEYARAFAGAGDMDQVEETAKALKELGATPDVSKHMGVVRRWHLAAPFDNVGGAGYERAYPPEKGVHLDAGYRGKDGAEVKWVEHSTSETYGLVDLNKALSKHKGAVAYAYAVIDSPSKREVEVRLGSATAVKVFLNGKEILGHEEYHHGMQVDQLMARGTLQKGRNELLLKVCQNEQKEAWAQGWTFQLRLCNRTGVAVPFSVVSPREAKP